MKIKYLIMRSNNCNGFWSYLGKEKVKPLSGEYITDALGDRFLMTGVEEAVQFNSKDEALQTIEGFNKLIVDILPNEKKYIGVGIFKIEEIYINEFVKEVNYE